MTIRTGTIILALACATAAWGNGFRLSDQDAFSTARGHAFTATADNASAVNYNPAGLTQIQGHELRGGAYGIYYNPHYKNPAGEEFENKEDLHLLPQVYYAYGPDRLPLAFGLGVYAPYGLSSAWDDETGFRTLATEGSLANYTINPAVAWRIHPNLSIAGTVRFSYAQADLAQGLFWPEQDYDEFRFEGDGWDVGYSLGVLWKLSEKIQFGGVFKSPMEVKLEGTTEYYNRVDLPLPGGGAIPAFPRQVVDAETEFPFPLNFVVGVSYRPNARWNLEFNADYTDWSIMDRLTIKQETAFPPLLPQNIVNILGWEPSWYYEFGATRYLDNGWHVSAGYIFNETSIPDANYNALVTDIDRHVFSAGVGFKKQRLSFDVAYQFVYGPTHTVRGSAPSVTGQTADGEYEFFSHAIHITAGYRF